MMRISRPSPTRNALRALWDLNVKTMPTALVWAVSFWFVIETHSLWVRVVGIFLANVSALVSAVLIVKKSPTTQKPQWKESVLDRFSWLMLMGTGLPFVLALENVSRHQGSSYFSRLVFISISMSCLIVWIIVVTILVPLRVRMDRSKDQYFVFVEGLGLIQHHKRRLFTSLCVLLFAWPFFFVYAFLALTFSQCMTLSSFDENAEPVTNTTNKRAHIA